jgi:hypothetical protein
VAKLVEVPEGDIMRYAGHAPERGMGPVFVNLNRGKRSVTLDLKTAEAMQAFEDLVRASDVVIEGMRPGFLAKRGYPFELKQWFPGKQPVVLVLGYYSCPAMCGQVLEAAFRALSEVDLQPGQDYRILSVSIDPRETAETAMARKQTFLPRLMQTGGDDAWRVLVGDDANIKPLAASVGFSYYWGGGCWDPGSSQKGACYGSCPDCRHTGRWGADCSGYVTKVWQVPGPQELTDCDRGPYTTREYYSSRTHWSQVSRGSARMKKLASQR